MFCPEHCRDKHRRQPTAEATRAHPKGLPSWGTGDESPRARFAEGKADRVGPCQQGRAIVGFKARSRIARRMCGDA